MEATEFSVASFFLGGGYRRVLGSRSLSQDPNGVEVEVLLLRVDLQNMLAGRQAHPTLADELEGHPVASVGHEDRPRDIHAVNLHVPLAGRESAADRRFQAIGAGLRDGD